MSYLSDLCKILSNSPGITAVTLGTMSLYFYFLRPRFKRLTYPVLIALSYLCLPLLYKLLLTLFGSTVPYSFIYNCLGYFSGMITLISFKDYLWNMIFLIFALSILNRIFTFFGYLLYLPLNTILGSNVTVKASASLTIIILYTIISIFCWFYLKERGRKLIQTDLAMHNWIILACISVLGRIIIDFCSNYAFALNPYTDINTIWAMIALSTLVLSFLIIYLYSSISSMKQSELKTSAERLIFEKEAQQRFYETQLQNQEELRKIKHDIKGNLDILFNLLSENKNDEALCYLTGLTYYNKNHQTTLYSDNPYINAVVNNFAAAFAENSINFQYEIQHCKIETHYVEMCLVLNNSLQNALEASLKLLPEMRYIKLQIKIKSSRYLFRITNRFNNVLILSDDFPCSTKKEDGHGFGLKSIRDAAESVGGFAVFKTEGDMFVLDVAM